MTSRWPAMASERESKIPPTGDPIRGVPAPAGTWPDHETSSGATTASGPDIGATGAFSPVLHGRRLHFVPAAGGFRDRETGSHWSVLGHADAGPLAGQNLTPITHEDTFWFVWAAFRPHTRVVS